MFLGGEFLQDTIFEIGGGFLQDRTNKTTYFYMKNVPVYGLQHINLSNSKS